jgi:hypothetical protein
MADQVMSISVVSLLLLLASIGFVESSNHRHMCKPLNPHSETCHSNQFDSAIQWPHRGDCFVTSKDPYISERLVIPKTLKIGSMSFHNVTSSKKVV